MGGCSVAWSFDGRLSEQEVRTVFADLRQADLKVNGSDPYSGTVHTIPSLKFVGQVAGSYDEAFDLALDRAVKWEYAIAVKYPRDGKLFWLVAGWAAE
jgi:hypothetical protein